MCGTLRAGLFRPVPYPRGADDDREEARHNRGFVLRRTGRRLGQSHDDRLREIRRSSDFRVVLLKPDSDEKVNGSDGGKNVDQPGSIKHSDKSYYYRHQETE